MSFAMARVVARRHPRRIQPLLIRPNAAARSSLHAPFILGCAWTFSQSHAYATTHCEQVASSAVAADDTKQSYHLVEHPSWSQSTLAEKVRRAWRLLKRWLKLSVTLAPCIAFYPLLVFLKRPAEDDAHAILLHDTDEPVPGLLGWYLSMCLRCVEHSGAAVIKLMQWAGSRPDLFGYDFCSIFSKLQDNTTPHRWRHTDKLLTEAYGADWKDKIELSEILGSGCIGQVYRGRVLKTTRDAEGRVFAQDNSMHVAVKVLHPGVHDDIDADLDLMRVAVRAVKYLPFDLFANLKWLNLEGVVEEFAGLLKLQIDFRREADNLVRFNENFKHDEHVEFPKLVPGFAATEKVLVETFCEGVPVVQFCRENQENKLLLERLCREAIRAVCNMIFLHNFVHGDLHPGNVFVSPDGKKFILFDVGIVNEYAQEDHNLIIDILAAFVRKQGRIAGRLMIDDSNNKLRAAATGDHALDEEKYIDKIEMLTIKASGKGYFMEHLGAYVTYICDAAAHHHVMMNPAFISAALAVKVQEGIALAMDPSCKIPKIAIPIIVESERRRLSSSAAELLSFKNIKEKLSYGRDT